MIFGAGGIGWAAAADVTDPTELRKAVGVIRRALGPIDLLVNNAGVLGPIGPLWEVDGDEVVEHLRCEPPRHRARLTMVLPEMVSMGRGRIINITSQAGVHRWPLVSGYSVSKAAVVKLTENLAHETRRHGVSVFSVHPGLLPVGMSETIQAHIHRPPTKRTSADGR